MVGNLLLFFVFVYGAPTLLKGWAFLQDHFWNFFIGGIGVVCIGILNSQLSADLKASIVFFRWKNPLPGCEAFTRFIHQDSRINPNDFKKRHARLPVDPVEQNSLWYKMYNTVSGNPSVVYSHKAYLLYRDWSCMALMLLLAFVILVFFQKISIWISLSYVGILLLQFLLAANAARINARRLVLNVLAIKATQG